MPEILEMGQPRVKQHSGNTFLEGELFMDFNSIDSLSLKTI